RSSRRATSQSWPQDLTAQWSRPLKRVRNVLLSKIEGALPLGHGGDQRLTRPGRAVREMGLQHLGRSLLGRNETGARGRADHGSPRRSKLTCGSIGLSQEKHFV